MTEADAKRLTELRIEYEQCPEGEPHGHGAAAFLLRLLDEATDACAHLEIDLTDVIAVANDAEQRLSEATAWQPIETAPRNPEVWIIGLGRFPNGGSRVQEDPAQGTACHWDGEFWADDNGTTYNLAWWLSRPALPPPPPERKG